ncbi:MBL fold metallo-hydrolase [Desulfuromonas sp. AOP6]|uniref:MBL fold metallo-hydrolase n=1 Tax=Desulfuromonas sp. AOP6 TaxID=1566351 RepID=UPI00126BA1C3|nr:MBL fold metallo-hydrolase [Desulfuromonas sp. AOP6]BCA79575.1 MBL fold metallo-hydrolase [Desulfuromonas sp. AOP6]
MIVECLSVGPLQVNCFIIADEPSREAMVVDPGDEGERIWQHLQEKRWTLKYIVNTHGHFDHIGGNRSLVEKAGAPLMIHPADVPLLQNAAQHAAIYGLKTVSSPEPQRLLNEGDVLNLGDLAFSVLHVPGHSPGGICFYGEGHLFAGDVLFAGSVGRTDLPGGDHDTLIQGIKQKLLVLPEQTVVHTGHGPDTTIGREKKSNPFVGFGS